MKNFSHFRKTLLITSALMVLLTVCSSAMALDGYQDRKGFFSGLGLGGGGIFQGGDPGGGIYADFQLGGGASKNLTLAMDFDLWFHLMDNNNNFLFTPGPEVNYFFGETGLFVRGGVGMAMTWVWLKGIPSGEDDKDFLIGFDMSVGAGWEFFGSSNTALALAIEGDYILLKGDDIASVAFAFNVKFY